MAANTWKKSQKDNITDWCYASLDEVKNNIRLFAYPEEKGFKMAEQVHKSGRVIVLTTSREHAELKQDQIHAFGADPLLARSKGSMTAVIEPAE